nr:zinc finger, CCHC-type [Tanacetum cinerariifolium]
MDSGDSYHITYRKDYLVDFKEYDGGNILLGDGRECRVRGTCKVPVQTRDGLSFVLNNVRQEQVIKGSLVVSSETRRANCRSTQQCTKSRVAKHLGVAGIQQQNRLVKETNVTLLAKVRCFLIQSGLSKVLWVEDTIMSTYLVNRSPSSAIECTGSVQVLQEAEFQVEPQEDHKFEVESHRNVDHVVDLQEVQTQDLIYHHSARDKEQHLTWDLFSYREDNNDAAFCSCYSGEDICTRVIEF